MKLILSALLSLWVLGLCLAVSKRGLRWCNTSKAEAAKCSKLRRNLKKVNGPLISCSRKASHVDCIQAIAKNKADAVALDSRLLFEAVMPPYNLQPVAAEYYGTEAYPETHFYAVAVVKKDSSFLLNQVKGVKSCHSAFNSSVGWDIPVGTLRPLLNWAGPSEPLQKAVAEFFSASCVPCADGQQYPNLCQLCSGEGENKCACSSDEPYFGDSGAMKCLKDGAGEVAFVASTVFETVQDLAERNQYELLCPDNTRKSVDEFKDCYLAQVPYHTIVARRVKGYENEIWEFLNQAQENFGKGKHPKFELFDSPSEEKDLLFKDDSEGFLRIPPMIDAGLYTGFNYIKVIRDLRETAEEAESRRARVLWCAVGPQEESKCQQWSAQSNGKVTCVRASTTEDCITLVMKGEADAMSLDGGFIYIAGTCGLVPVLAESQKSGNSSDSDCVNRPVEGYYAVAVVRKSNADLTWNSLKNKKSCHTAVGRTAGWNIPMGLLFQQTKSCRFDEFFSQSCAPGSDPSSSLCALCVGNESGQDKCASNSNERYFGYNGAFRCLAENAGDVAFVKDTTVLENTNGKNTEPWANGLNLEDFELLCLDGTRKPVTEADSCHLARSPSHGVVSRKDKVEHLEQVLLDQQAEFGNGGSNCPSKFCLFQSETKNLLFNDNTECLAKLHGKTTYEKYLGKEYVTAISNLRECSVSALLETCNFLRR